MSPTSYQAAPPRVRKKKLARTLAESTPTRQRNDDALRIRYSNSFSPRTMPHSSRAMRSRRAGSLVTICNSRRNESTSCVNSATWRASAACRARCDRRSVVPYSPPSIAYASTASAPLHHATRCASRVSAGLKAEERATGILGVPFQLLFDTQQLIVLGHPVTA